MKILNSGDYWNRTGNYESTGLTLEAKKMIDDAKWYLGGPRAYGTENVIQFYSHERSTTVTSDYPTSWVGKVGLMYPSDYGYATSGGTTGRENCLTTAIRNWENANECKNNDWLYTKLWEWTLTPATHTTYTALKFTNTGYIYSSNAYDPGEFRPTVYLASYTLISGGTGTQSDPYTLSR